MGGLTEKEWRVYESIFICAFFSVCVIGFGICQKGVGEAKAATEIVEKKASDALEKAIAARTKQMDGIVIELKEYQEKNSSQHSQIMYAQALIAAKLGVLLPEPR